MSGKVEIKVFRETELTTVAKIKHFLSYKLWRKTSILSKSWTNCNRTRKSASLPFILTTPSSPRRNSLEDRKRETLRLELQASVDEEKELQLSTAAEVESGGNPSRRSKLPTTPPTLKKSPKKLYFNRWSKWDDVPVPSHLNDVLSKERRALAYNIGGDRSPLKKRPRRDVSSSSSTSYSSSSMHTHIQHVTAQTPSTQDDDEGVDAATDHNNTNNDSTASSRGPCCIIL